jgi:hypothetical protein
MTETDHIRECREGAQRNARHSARVIQQSHRFAAVVFLVAGAASLITGILTDQDAINAFLYVWVVFFIIQGMSILYIGKSLSNDFLKIRQSFLETADQWKGQL